MASDKQNEDIKTDKETSSTGTESDSDDEDFREEITDLEDWSFVGDLGEHDLTLIVEKHKIYVSRVVLCLASPVFRAMLQSDFKEKNLKEVDLPEKKYEYFVEFLRCIYPNMLKHITGDNVDHVLPLATEYQVKVLEERCQKVLMEVVRKNPERVFELIELADTYNMEDLMTICVYIASESSPQCIENATSKVSAKTLLQIYFLNAKRNDLNKEDDKDLFQRGSVHISDFPDTSGFNLGTVDCKAIMMKYFDQYQYDLSSTCRYVRLSHRFMPELLKKYTDILEDNIIRCYLSGYPVDLDISLLPESVKQSLTIPEDSHQYFYSPKLFADVPKPVTKNEEHPLLTESDPYMPC